jgi:hypothetical protein
MTSSDSCRLSRLSMSLPFGNTSTPFAVYSTSMLQLRMRSWSAFLPRYVRPSLLHSLRALQPRRMAHDSGHSEIPRPQERAGKSTAARKGAAAHVFYRPDSDGGDILVGADHERLMNLPSLAAENCRKVLHEHSGAATRARKELVAHDVTCLPAGAGRTSARPLCRSPRGRR